MELALSFFHSVYPKWVNSNVSRTLSLSSRELSGELHHSIWMMIVVVSWGVKSIRFCDLFQGEWNVMMVFFLLLVMKFLSIAEWDYYSVSVFLCVSIIRDMNFFMHLMFYADTDKRKTVVVCGGVGDWTMEGKYELTSVIITEDIAHSHTTEEPEKRRKWTFATL